MRRQAQAFHSLSARARAASLLSPSTTGCFDQVLHHAEVRPQVVLLEHHADILAQFANRVVGRRLAEIEVVAGNLQATGTRQLQQVEHAQE